MIVEVFGFVWT